jgi:hypothetical protein
MGDGRWSRADGLLVCCAFEEAARSETSQDGESGRVRERGEGQGTRRRREDNKHVISHACDRILIIITKSEFSRLIQSNPILLSRLIVNTLPALLGYIWFRSHPPLSQRRFLSWLSVLTFAHGTKLDLAHNELGEYTARSWRLQWKDRASGCARPNPTILKPAPETLSAPQLHRRCRGVRPSLIPRSSHQRKKVTASRLPGVGVMSALCAWPPTSARRPESWAIWQRSVLMRVSQRISRRSILSRS